MATLIGTYYGNQAGPHKKFRVVTQFQYTNTDPSKGVYLQRRHYVEVVIGGDENFTNNLKVSWDTSRYALSVVGAYAVQDWQDIGWVKCGNAVSYDCNAYYTGVSGTVYKSTASGTCTVPNIQTYSVITLTYDANGGIGWADMSEEGKIYNDESYCRFKVTSNIPTRENYVFLGWAISPKATVASFFAGDSIVLSWSDALYAVWQSESSLYIRDENDQFKKGNPWAGRRKGIPWININGLWKKGGA